MIRYRRKPVKDYLAGVARTIFTPTLSRNGTTPATALKSLRILLKYIRE
jgi:hypothetical protein